MKVEWKLGIYRENSFLSSLIGSLDLAVHRIWQEAGGDPKVSELKGEININ